MLHLMVQIVISLLLTVKMGTYVDALDCITTFDVTKLVTSGIFDLIWHSI
jgi:hypothetical protein